MFGAGMATRLRPSFFPFTEPSAEMDFQCWVCLGESGATASTAPCRTCGGTGWIEWGGCGMVNRNVLLAAGVDPGRLHRVRVRDGHRPHDQLRNGVSDMHDIVEGDARFSAQFGMEI